MFLKSSAAHWPVVSVADLHSKTLDVSPPRPNYFNFTQFGKFWQNCMLAPPGGGIYIGHMSEAVHTTAAKYIHEHYFNFQYNKHTSYSTGFMPKLSVKTIHNSGALWTHSPLVEILSFSYRFWQNNCHSSLWG